MPQQAALFLPPGEISRLGPPIDVESLVHSHAWESCHSLLNQAGGAHVPSRRFSSAFDLRGIPQSFHQILPDGTAAALSLRAPAGFRDRLLYLREDLVLQYAGGRQLIWEIWGERFFYPYWRRRPAWLVRAHEDREHVGGKFEDARSCLAPEGANGTALDTRR